MKQNGIDLPSRDDFHPLRKTWHVFGGLTFAFGYEFLGVTQFEAIILSGFIFGIFSLLEIARSNSPAVNNFLVGFWKPFIRKHEVNQHSGMFYYTAGVFTCSLFAKPIVMLSILYLAIGDPFASLLGISFKHVSSMRLQSGKSLVGTLGMWILCIFVGYYFLNSIGVNPNDTLMIATFSGMIAALAELACPKWFVDDNFLIPVSSACALWLSFRSAGINPYHINSFSTPLRF